MPRYYSKKPSYPSFRRGVKKSGFRRQSRVTARYIKPARRVYTKRVVHRKGYAPVRYPVLRTNVVPGSSREVRCGMFLRRVEAVDVGASEQHFLSGVGVYVRVRGRGSWDGRVMFLSSQENYTAESSTTGWLEQVVESATARVPRIDSAKFWVHKSFSIMSRRETKKYFRIGQEVGHYYGGRPKQDKYYYVLVYLTYDDFATPPGGCTIEFDTNTYFRVTGWYAICYVMLIVINCVALDALQLRKVLLVTMTVTMMVKVMMMVVTICLGTMWIWIGVP
jgi:hypothetical protein